MCWENRRLRFFDTETEIYLNSHDEERAGRMAAQSRPESAESRAEQERADRMAAESRANIAENRAESAERRVAELEAELRRLRGE